MTLPRRLGFLVALACLAGCSPVPRVMDSSYRPSDLRGRLLRVMPIDSLIVHNMLDFRDDWMSTDGAKDPATVLSDFLGESVWSRADHVEVLYDEVPAAESDLRDTLLTVPGKDGPMETVFRFPADSVLRRRSVVPDLALLVSDVEFNQYARPRTSGKTLFAEPPAGWSGQFGVGSPSYDGEGTYLCLEGKYLVWDYRKQAPVAYGVLEGCTGFYRDTSTETWKHCMDHAVRMMLDRTPFNGERNQAGPGNPRKSKR